MSTTVTTTDPIIAPQVDIICDSELLGVGEKGALCCVARNGGGGNK